MSFEYKFFHMPFCDSQGPEGEIGDNGEKGDRGKDVREFFSFKITIVQEPT